MRQSCDMLISGLDPCKLCEESEETITHVLLQCSKLCQTRSEHLNSILQIFEQQSISVDPENVIKCIMDTMHLKFWNKENTIHIEQHIRTMCYCRHLTRNTILIGNTRANANIVTYSKCKNLLIPL